MLRTAQATVSVSMSALPHPGRDPDLAHELADHRGVADTRLRHRGVAVQVEARPDSRRARRGSPGRTGSRARAAGPAGDRVSMPSATTVIPSSSAIERTAATIARSSEWSATCSTNIRSILIWSSGSTRSKPSEEAPPPKSSIAIRTPSAFSSRSAETSGRAVGEQRRLRHLEAEQRRGQAALLQRLRDLAGHVADDELTRRDVDGDVELAAAAAPVRRLAAGPVQDELPDFADQAVLLRDRDELQRPDHSAQRVLPAHERLAADRGAVAERDDRLVLDAQLALVQRLAQLALDARAAPPARPASPRRTLRLRRARRSSPGTSPGRPRPAARRRCAAAPGPNGAIPIDAVSRRSIPAIVTDAWRFSVSRISPAIFCACSIGQPGRTTANSSPPSRASVSVARRRRRSCSATRASSESPAMCPSESLMSLKRSRSSIRTAPTSPLRCAKATSRASSSMNRRRLKRPESESWLARCQRRSSSPARPVTSCVVPTSRGESPSRPSRYEPRTRTTRSPPPGRTMRCW